MTAQLKCIQAILVLYANNGRYTVTKDPIFQSCKNGEIWISNKCFSRMHLPFKHFEHFIRCQASTYHKKTFNCYWYKCNWAKIRFHILQICKKKKRLTACLTTIPHRFDKLFVVPLRYDLKLAKKNTSVNFFLL